jgi:S1-C subfamily serine protease
VPVDTVARLVPQLIAKGRIVTPGIGISVIPQRVAVRLGVPGVPVAEVAQLTRARRLLVGDRILAVDGKTVESEDDLRDACEVAGVGKAVTLTVARGGEQRQVQVPLVQID